MSRVSFATLLACAALALAAASAAADGLPVVVDGSSGVVSSDGASRFVTLAVGARHTVIERLKLHTGEVARYRTLPGSWSIPAVAYDGTGSGLSSDGRTLVVIRNRTRFPQRRTYLAVVDPVRLRIERRLALRGDFSFDAISPDGSTVYLINYLSARDPTRYAVRAFDVARGRLLPGAIVDPHEPGEQMGGVPITRTTSPDGRWAYTLYAGKDHPFVHALDTSGRTARCVDIGALAGRQDLFAIRMKTTPGGDRLTIASQDGRPLAVLDARTFRVSEPVRAPAAAKAAAPGQDARPWLVPAGLALLLLLLTGAGYAGRNRMLARAARAR